MASLVLLATGCARIYRPVELVAAPTSMHRGELTGQIVHQPWGDNSRYEEKALRSHLRVLVLALENDSDAQIEILRLELPEGTSALTPAAALKLVKQQPLLYLFYPLLPGLLIPGANNKGSIGPSDQAMFSALAVVGLAIGIPNAMVAARSNTRLGAFFNNQAWSPRPLGPGQGQRGLIFLRCTDRRAPLTLQVVYRNAAGEQRLELSGPEAPPF
ncbi:MAG TPA: hypothetical protein VJ486_10870 [Geothrix sp.]|nr:hypothetical protein [Geothrix sp.]